MFPGARPQSKQPVLHLQYGRCFGERRYRLVFSGPLEPASQSPSLKLCPLFCSELGLADLVEDMCPLLPSLEQALKDVEQLAGAGAGARHSQYIHLTEVVVPMLCSYTSLWWSRGPEGPPGGPVCTAVTPQHASDLLGHVLRIIHNHVGTSQGDWMKRMAGILACDFRV